ncbi:hypothetical protein TWF506_003917 [Arthrobotrys conoides]|uniref:Uncharacterized protein n=1 Tax=Arthrobotrys conoides TaxID=74498 RepID=A0AAN8N2Z1_9PEZI
MPRINKEEVMIVCRSHNTTTRLHPLHGAQILLNPKFLQTLGTLNEVFLDGLNQLLSSTVSPVVLVSVWSASGCEEEVSATAELIVDLSEVAHFVDCWRDYI